MESGLLQFLAAFNGQFSGRRPRRVIRVTATCKKPFVLLTAIIQSKIDIEQIAPKRRHFPQPIFTGCLWNTSICRRNVYLARYRIQKSGRLLEGRRPECRRSGVFRKVFRIRFTFPAFSKNILGCRPANFANGAMHLPRSMRRRPLLPRPEKRNVHLHTIRRQIEIFLKSRVVFFPIGGIRQQKAPGQRKDIGIFFNAPRKRAAGFLQNLLFPGLQKWRRMLQGPGKFAAGYP